MKHDDYVRTTQFAVIGGLVLGFPLFAYGGIGGFLVGAIAGALLGLAIERLTQ